MAYPLRLRIPKVVRLSAGFKHTIGHIIDSGRRGPFSETAKRGGKEGKEEKARGKERKSKRKNKQSAAAYLTLIWFFLQVKSNKPLN